MFRQWLHNTLSELYPGHDFAVLVPPDAKMGDYSTNIAMVAKKNPQEVCSQLLAIGSELIARCEVASPGFVNIFLKDSYLQAQLGKREIPQIGQGKKVIIEYSAPNIAKPMSVGHLRSTIIGDALSRVYRALGYDVVRWNYIGDWGTQFGKLIAAYRRYGGADQELTIAHLVALYVRFHAEIAENPELEKEGQEEFRKLEAGDSENRRLWELFRAESLKEFQRMYDQFDVPFDVVKGESSYQEQLPGVLAAMKPILTESEGAQVVMLDEFGLPPAIVQKSDGASIYMARDVASLEDRIDQYHPAKILYVVGNEQALHFEQLFAVAKKMHLDASGLVHVKFGMVLGDDGKKFSTRKGDVVLLQDVVDKIVALAGQRNPDSAVIIGIGALKYNDLRQHPHSDIIFDWDAMLNLSGNSGPYLQYAYARLASILKKFPISNFQFPNNIEIKNSKLKISLSHPLERALMRQLLDFGYAVAQCAELYALNGLALYLYELANTANRYYEEVRIGDDENQERKSARLYLISRVMQTLKEGLAILGIGTLERI